MRIRRSRRPLLTATPVVELQQVALGPLRAFDLVIYAGERVGVLGDAGSGKTVLAELVAGARQPEQGRVRRDGVDVTISPSWAGELAAGSSAPGRQSNAAAGVAWLAQEPRPFRRLTVYENILVAALAVPRRSSRVAEGFAQRSMSRLDLDLLADRLPSRLTTPQLARLEAARALAAPTRLVVVDQLSQRVDPGTAAQIRAALGESVAEGAAILWLETPDEPPAEVDRLVLLAYGRVAEEGPAEQVLATSRLSRTRRSPTATPTSGPSGAHECTPAGAPTSAPAGTPGGAPTAASATNGTATSNGFAGPAQASENRSVPGGGAAQVNARRDVPLTAAVLRVREWTATDRGHSPVEALNLDVQRGELVAVIGGRDERATLLLRTLAGLLDARGRLWVDDRELTGLTAAARARAGMAFVPRDGAVVDRLTVADHLVLAGARRRRRRWSTRAIYQMVPSLGTARHRPAGALPPLERRCLALARALVTDPCVLVVDRPAHGVPDPVPPVLAHILTEAARSAAVLVADEGDGLGVRLASRVVHLLDEPASASGRPVRSA